MKTRREDDRPTFIGIGGVKCASTWIAECLRSHPQVFVTSPKEVHYFDSLENIARGEQWYWKHFRGSRDCVAAGEIGATYLGSAVSVSAMRKMLGPVQVVASLRDPVERFLSEYKHRIRGGQLPKRQFTRLSLRNLHAAIEICPTLCNWSLYANRLEEFFTKFSRERTLVVLKDDIDARPRESLSVLYRFLGVDCNFVPPVIEKPVSPGIVPRSMVLERLRIGIYSAVRRPAPWIIDLIRRTRLAELYRRMNSSRTRSGLVIESGVREQLQAMFAQDIEDTERLLGRSLATWQQPRREAA